VSHLPDGGGVDAAPVDRAPHISSIHLVQHSHFLDPLENLMKIPGLTTTRVHLVLAVMCATTGTVAGAVTAGAVLAVLCGRLLLIRHHRAQSLSALIPSITRAPAVSPSPVAVRSLGLGRPA
jgi:predicted lysophospholipase L1 biosynthesis ABC-type transport system permease subunit